MKKITFVLAAAGLMSLAACQPKTPDAQNIENQADLQADNIENLADNLDATADNITNSASADAVKNAADNLNAKADNVRDAADAKADNVTKAETGGK